MRIVISGAHGLVGSTLVKHFLNENHDVFCLVRNPLEVFSDQQILLDIKNKTIEDDRLEGADIVIHLAGANIASKRWSKKYKTQILDSRLTSTQIIAKALAQLKNPPKLFLCASAVGYYGNQWNDEPITESACKGNGFLSDVCDLWEKSTFPAKNAGIRTINLRFGAILSKKSGALAKMLIPFRLGLGGRVGDGFQYFSWISIEEIPGIIDFITKNEKISGPVNVVSPELVQNHEFTRLLAHELNQPAFIPMPATIVRLVFGEMGESILLGGANVVPQKLIDHKYPFKYPLLGAALKSLLGNSK